MQKHYFACTVKLISFITCLFLTLIILLPQSAYPWGSLAPAKTHQYICQEAYKKLAADPAFDSRKFPTLEEILNNEGVTWVRYQWTGAGYIGLGIEYDVLKGNGPDSKGASMFSEHYYNPKISSDNKGGAPAAVAKYYKYLAEGAMTGKKEPLPKAAAWSAHFLADMYCPYHINGSDRATIKAIYDDQNAKHQGTIDLADDVKGSVKLGYLQPIKFVSNNFNTEVTRFLTKSDEDWFDPWYYNGDTEFAMSETSSHIAWETTINPAGDAPAGYSSDWKNAEPAKNFTAPWTAQAQQAKFLAIAAATETSKNIDAYFDKPAPAVNKAIQAVATMWRASITAINPSFDIKQPAEYILVKGKIENKGDVNLTDTEIKLTVSGCSLASWNDSQKLGTIAAGGTKLTDEIKVKPGNLPCHLKLQAVAASTKPDLQYAETETTITPKVEEKKPVVTDSPVGAEEVEVFLSTSVKNNVNFLRKDLKIPDDLNLPLEETNVSSAQCTPKKVQWNGNAFTIDCTVKYDRRFFAQFPPYTNIGYDAGEHAISISGSIDEVSNSVKSIHVKATWKLAAKYASECWDLPQPVNTKTFAYTFNNVPFKEKGYDNYSNEKNAEYVYYRYTLPFKDFPGKISGLSYSTRLCLYPGRTFDATDKNLKESPSSALQIILVKKRPVPTPAAPAAVPAKK